MQIVGFNFHNILIIFGKNRLIYSGGTMRRQLFLFAVLGAVLIISGCSPVSTAEVNQPVVENTVVVTDVVIQPQSTELPDVAETAPALLQVAVPTSRGDQLVATDPAAVNLTAGVPTLVEFFRFT
jgi:hypothetical protein